MRTPSVILAVGALAASAPLCRAAVAPLRVTATSSTIASLVRVVGGDEVAVTLLDHERPTAGVAPVAAVLAQSQLVVRNGDPAEADWLAPLLAAAPNASIRPGGRAHLDASRVGSPADCSPYELLDPMRGLALAKAVRDTLEVLRPARRAAFTEAYEAFRARLSVAMLGDRLGTKYPIEKVADLHRLGTLQTFLAAQRESALLGGWFGRLRASHGVKVAADRAAWGCFAQRFGIDIAAVADSPGSASPEELKKRGVRLILVGTGRRAAALRAAAGRGHIPLASLAGQVGPAPAPGDYLALIDHDVRAVERALGEAPRGGPKTGS